MHFVKAKGILSGQNGMNIYRGCQHGCIYCDARSTCYQMHHVFEDIEVKENAIELLESALRSKRKPCMVGFGPMSDPYMPLEEKLGMTRRALELIEKYGFGATVLTKSDRVLRDLELLQRINEKTKAVVQMSLTAADEKLSRIIEPNVCPTTARIRALKAFGQAGVPTVAWICPILPYLTDTEENIRFLVEACAGARVKGIIWFGAGLTLRDGDREYFYKMLDRHFPGLKEVYIRQYGMAYEVPSPRCRELDALFHSLCERYGILHGNDAVFQYLHRFPQPEGSEQLTFF